MFILNDFSVATNNHYKLVAGTCELPQEHELCTVFCWMPSQSKSIAKYLPYKESKTS